VLAQIILGHAEIQSPVPGTGDTRRPITSFDGWRAFAGARAWNVGKVFKARRVIGVSKSTRTSDRLS